MKPPSHTDEVITSAADSSHSACSDTVFESPAPHVKFDASTSHEMSMPAFSSVAVGASGLAGAAVRIVNLVFPSAIIFAMVSPPWS